MNEFQTVNEFQTGPMTVMHCLTRNKLHKLTMNSIGTDNRIDRGVLKEEVSKNVGGICRTPLKLSIVILIELVIFMHGNDVHCLIE